MKYINVSKLPSSKHFSILYIKQLLPIHQDKIEDNLNIILNNYALSGYPQKILLLPDDRLGVQPNSTTFCYDNCQAVWTDDIDGQPEHLKNTLALASSILNYIGSIDEDAPFQENQIYNNSYIQKSDILFIDNGNKVYEKKSLFSQIYQNKTLVGFKVHKIGQRVYIYIGVNIKTRYILAFSCSTLRNWNMNRLKIYCLPIKTNLIHKICEHLFCMGRGFMREVSDDYNTYSANLFSFLSSSYSYETYETLCQKFKNAKLSSINIGNIPQSAVMLKWHITFRNYYDQRSLWIILAEIITYWLLYTPINVSCSYSSFLEFDEKTRILTIALGSHFTTTKHKFPTTEDMEKVITNIQMFLFDHTFKKPKAEKNSFRDSIALLNKYQAPLYRENLTLTRQLTPSESNPSLNDSLYSQRSSESKPRSIKQIAKLYNQIYYLLKMLDSNNNILNCEYLEMMVRTYVKKLIKINREFIHLSDKYYEVMEILDAINLALSAYDFYTLLRNNYNDVHLLATFLMQRDQYLRTVSVAKIVGEEHLENVYKRSLKEGLMVQRNTIIPCYLKKMVQAYVVPAIAVKSLKIDYISVPALVYVVERKNYDSHFYSSVLTLVLPQLFQNFYPILQILAPILFHYVDQLLRMDHHQYLVFSFLGDLLFYICYFTTETKLNSLTNAVYMEQQQSKILSIKEKKVLEMLREGGFKGFGFEIKNLVLPIIEKYKNYQVPEYLIYHCIKVYKPLELYHFFKLLSLSHYTPSIDKISKFLEHNNNYSSVLNRNSPMVCFFLPKNRPFNYDFRLRENKNDDGQFDSIAERILRSESGIFQDIVKLNPKVKIAGIYLQSAIKSLSHSKLYKVTNSKGYPNEYYAVDYYLSTGRKTFEFISLALSLKYKYLRYPTLTYSYKSYFRDCASSVIYNKQYIVYYLALCSKIKMYNQRKY